MKREIVNIDEDKCNGCGLCVPACHEGALQIIDKKAVLVSDLMCDGLGACLGHCPEGAITIETREAEPYDEIKVMKEMISKGKNVVTAHLRHLRDHNEQTFLKQGVRYLWENKDILDFNPAEVVEDVYGLKPVSSEYRTFEVITGKSVESFRGCPGTAPRVIEKTHENKVASERVKSAEPYSELTHWPIQLHLINPAAGHFKGSDLLLSADCAAFSAGNFHDKFLKNKKLIIACPKLDQKQGIYVDKIKQLIDEAGVKTITVIRMEVPCCSGLTQMVLAASQKAGRNVPVREVVISISGEEVMEDGP